MERIVLGFSGMRFVVNGVLREIFGGKMEKLTGGWKILNWALGE
jgi:hypothetical protein